MNKEIMELIKQNQSLHLECSADVMADLKTYFGQLESASIFCRDFDLYEYMSIREYLRFFAQINGNRNLLDTALEEMALSNITRKKIAKCTADQKTRITIAKGIISNPQVYFMIEPLRQIDDEETLRIILSWMERVVTKGKQLITLSHSLKEICLCPGKHYHIRNDVIQSVDNDEDTDTSDEESLLLNKLSVKSDGNIFLFNPEEIDYVEASDGKCIVAVRNETYTSTMKLDELEQKLKQFGFYRCHRSYLVNIQKMTEIVKWTRSSYSLRLSKENKFMVPLSKGKIQEIKDIIQL